MAESAANTCTTGECSIAALVIVVDFSNSLDAADVAAASVLSEQFDEAFSGEIVFSSAASVRYTKDGVSSNVAVDEGANLSGHGGPPSSDESGFRVKERHRSEPSLHLI